MRFSREKGCFGRFLPNNGEERVENVRTAFANLQPFADSEEIEQPVPKESNDTRKSDHQQTTKAEGCAHDEMSADKAGNGDPLADENGNITEEEWKRVGGGFVQLSIPIYDPDVTADELYREVPNNTKNIDFYEQEEHDITY
jgi:hypothetical protein